MTRLKNIDNEILKENNRWFKAVSSVSRSGLNSETGRPYSVNDIVTLFDKDSILLGTTSRIIRDNPEKIKEYFDFFANIPGINIKHIEHNVSKVQWIILFGSPQKSSIHIKS